MEKVLRYIEKIGHTKIINSLIIILISFILYKCFSYFFNRIEKKDNLNFLNAKKTKTYLKLVKSVIRYIFTTITILIVLQINGINVNSILAGVGILGAIFGLAIQDWLKDIIRGSSILSDNYFSVEDIVKYKDIEGKVLLIGLKTTKIQDLKTGNIISIANRNIEEIQRVSNLIYIDVPMPYELSIKKVEKVIEDIVNNIKENKEVRDCKYKGVNELADSSIKYLLEINTNPIHKLQVRRDALKTIILELENNNIKIPYNKIEIHQK